MEKYYYARQLDTEYFDHRCYYSEEDAAYDNFYAGGNRDFAEFNGDLRTDITKKLENCMYDLDAIDSDNMDEMLETLKYYFGDLSKDELFKLADLTKDFNDCSSSLEVSIIAQVLSIMKHEEFTSGLIRGNCQGDWAYYICPKAMENRIPWIEAVLFASGTEFVISEEKCTREEFENDFENDKVFTYCAYTHHYNSQDIKEQFAEVLNCSPDEIKLLTIANTYTTVHYDYAEE